MGFWQILILVAIGVIVIVAAYYLISTLFGDSSKMDTQMRSMMSSRATARYSSSFTGAAKKHTDQPGQLNNVMSEGKVEHTTSSKLTIRKKLKFASWKISPATYRAAQVAISIFAITIVHLKFNLLIQLISLLIGPIFMGWLLNRSIQKRFLAFDADYPQMLLSLVGLLKTGMNPITALDAAAKGLEDQSAVRQEIQLMIERLRFGVSEEKSIGSFGEDIFHPEIELFVQALLLSRRVGGNLSDTLDRLAKQVRKRQYFRNSAMAAVGMQRGSIWLILGLLGGLEGFLYFTYPKAVVGAWEDPIGWQVWQVAVVLILLGIFWIRQVTKLKI